MRRWQSFIRKTKKKIQGELPSVKAQIAEFLQQQQANKLQYDLAQRLRAAPYSGISEQPEPQFKLLPLKAVYLVAT